MDKYKIEFTRVDNLEVPTSETAIAHELIVDAADLVKNDNFESAAWRIADALLIIGKSCDKGTVGIDTPTGRGAILCARPSKCLK